MLFAAGAARAARAGGLVEKVMPETSACTAVRMCASARACVPTPPPARSFDGYERPGLRPGMRVVHQVGELVGVLLFHREDGFHQAPCRRIVVLEVADDAPVA